MKYLWILLAGIALTSCASTGEVCPQSDQSELCQCYRREIPRSVCYDRSTRFDR
jgi:hypothetical protein